MSIATIENVEEFCPKCGSSNVVMEVESGFYYFSICRKCGYSVNRNLDSTTHSFS